MKKALLGLGLFGTLLFPQSLRAEDISLEQVVLRGLDKITGRLSTMTINVGEKTSFGALDIYARVCYVHPPEETPENAAYLEVVENKDEGQLKLFSGWMFSSSPALSAMDHAVYDVWVLKCQGEPIKPPKPEPLVLEHPLEPQPIQPKLKIIVKENKENVSPSMPEEEKAKVQEEILPMPEEEVKPQEPETEVQEQEEPKILKELVEEYKETP